MSKSQEQDVLGLEVTVNDAAPCACGHPKPHHQDFRGDRTNSCQVIGCGCIQFTDVPHNIIDAMRDEMRLHRPGWDDYFMIIADAVSLRMSCDRARIGAVVVSPDHRILATGYGGAPSGLPSCDEVGHQLVTINGRESCVRTVHAETNAVIFAARHGVRLDGATLYTTASTCADCARAMIQAGIKRIVYATEYTSARSGGEDILAMLRTYGVQVDHVPLKTHITLEKE